MESIEFYYYQGSHVNDLRLERNLSVMLIVFIFSTKLIRLVRMLDLKSSKEIP